MYSILDLLFRVFKSVELRGFWVVKSRCLEWYTRGCGVMGKGGVMWCDMKLCVKNGKRDREG